MIVAGGALAYGGLQISGGDIRIHNHAPGQVNTALDQWARLAPVPGMDDLYALRCRIHQSDYAAVPANNQLVYGKRAEIVVKPEILAWGAEYTYYWRFVIDPDWVFLDGETTTVIHQVHEMGASASPPANPVFAAVYGPGGYQIIWRHDGIPDGQVIYSSSAQPGDEIEVFLRVKWADVSHVAAAAGIFELSVNGVEAFSANAQQNTWNVPEDTYPPYPTAGTYRYDPTAPWWAGHDKTMYHVALVVGDTTETLTSIRAHVADQMAEM